MLDVLIFAHASPWHYAGTLFLIAWTIGWITVGGCAIAAEWRDHD